MDLYFKKTIVTDKRDELYGCVNFEATPVHEIRERAVSGMSSADPSPSLPLASSESPLVGVMDSEIDDTPDSVSHWLKLQFRINLILSAAPALAPL